MKVLFGLSILLILGVSCATPKNQDGFTQFYNDYKKTESVIGFSAPTWIAQVFLITKDRNIRKVFRKFKTVSFFIADDYSQDLLDELNNCVSSDIYVEVVRIRDQEDKISLSVRDDGVQISELLMVLEEDDSFVVIRADGSLSYEDMSDMLASFDTASLVQLRD